jgi:negative regulator of sigma E activity
MSQDPHEYVEQLSAFMDGELPDAEARFLLRRLEHDAELRAAWTRMQLASQCLRAQPWRPMDAAFPGRVAASLEDEAPAAQRRSWLRWAVAASVLALGVLMAPHLRQAPAAPAALADAPAPAAVDHIVASPASADLVAERPAARATGALTTPEASVRSEDAPLVAAVEPSDRASPLPLDAGSATESPTEFPLVDTGEQRSWPRSEVVNASSDPSIEAYLVRHNQMIAEDGLGGFVPYVDVVSNSQPAANADATPATDANAQESDGQ